MVVVLVELNTIIPIDSDLKLFGITFAMIARSVEHVIADHTDEKGPALLDSGGMLTALFEIINI